MIYYDITLPKSRFRYWCTSAQKMGAIWVFAIHIEMPMRKPITFLHDSSAGLMERQEFIDICEEWVEKNVYTNAGVSKYDLEKKKDYWHTEWDKRTYDNYMSGMTSSAALMAGIEGWTGTPVEVVRTSARPASDGTLRTTTYPMANGQTIEVVHLPIFDGPVPQEHQGTPYVDPSIQMNIEVMPPINIGQAFDDLRRMGISAVRTNRTED